jgi:hypothetical protein
MKKPAVTDGGLSGEVRQAGETSVPGTADTATPPHRRRCRVKGCRATIPYAVGYSPDWTCWRHHRLVVPPLETAGVGR